jgi:hypothetical protein
VAGKGPGAEGRVSTCLSGTAYIHVARAMASHEHRAAMIGVRVKVMFGKKPNLNRTAL